MTVDITYIGVATTVIDINGVRFLTDPCFDPAQKYDMGIAVLEKTIDPAIKINELPPIDAILLSHEDHPDNLDTTGRTLLPGRHVFTTTDGAKNLTGNPGVLGLKPWEKTIIELQGQKFTITATPCVHLEGGEVIGFVIESQSLGTGSNGKPNAVYFSGDTIYLPELKKIREQWNVKASIFNVGVAMGPPNENHSEPYKITMDGKDAAVLANELDTDYVIPVHFEAWTHFAQNEEALKKDLQDAGIMDKVVWLPKDGKPINIF
ncbi:similar to Naumovozyma castellii NCAS_0J00150 hypothetical protein [Maudiozyma saulgeensis]|uniref:Metallo-beta-lactamase domain-containing protein n=1 Tax=Maudiozyma saulgeensis TaxID=1789683 RepID=A0A1X7RB91_9SACH|nr:similar to Naumovozyma castellii NCAS_0J00150 hypothetical protein [Kazachstania saulgeensis]